MHPLCSCTFKKSMEITHCFLFQNIHQVHINPIVILSSKNTIIIIHFKTISCTAVGEKFKTNCTLTAYLYRHIFFGVNRVPSYMCYYIYVLRRFISVFMFVWILCECIICSRPEHRVKCDCPNCCLSQRSSWGHCWGQMDPWTWTTHR